jgi:hypothetical protein
MGVWIPLYCFEKPGISSKGRPPTAEMRASMSKRPVIDHSRRPDTGPNIASAFSKYDDHSGAGKSFFTPKTKWMFAIAAAAIFIVVALLLT